MTKPKDTSAPNIQLPNIETQHPDILEYAWLKLDKFVNVDSKRLDSMSETELNDTNRELQENTESISGGIQQASGEIQSAIGAESDSEATLGDMSETIGRINELQQQQQGFIDSASKYNSDAIETDRLIGSTIASGGANIDSMSRRDEEIRGIIQQLQEINGENSQKTERSKNS